MKKYLFLGLFVSSMFVQAQDRLFTYTYQSGVLNQSQKEIEVWTTLKNGRTNFYRGIDHRMEFEIGLGSKLQTSLYLNYGYSSAVENENGIQNIVSNSEYSVSNEWKLKLSDPMANRIGSAIYLEGEVSSLESSLEGKLILDKQMGKFVSALNLVGEYVNGHEFVVDGALLHSQYVGELNLEWNYGLSYKIHEHVNLGLEIFNQNQIVDSKWSNSVLQLGPCVSYSINGFWVNLSIMPQVADLKGTGLELKEHERLQTRLAFSYAL